MDSADASLMSQIRREIGTDFPPIIPGQIWVTRLGREGQPPMRRIRIIAEYPFRDPFFKDEKDRLWLYENMPGGSLRLNMGEISRCPEFNLRYVFRPEEDNGV